MNGPTDRTGATALVLGGNRGTGGVVARRPAGERCRIAIAQRGQVEDGLGGASDLRSTLCVRPMVPGRS